MSPIELDNLTIEQINQIDDIDEADRLMKNATDHFKELNIEQRQKLLAVRARWGKLQFAAKLWDSLMMAPEQYRAAALATYPASLPRPKRAQI